MRPNPLSREDHERAGELYELARGLPAGRREDAVRAAAGYTEVARSEALALLAHSPGDGFLRAPAVTSASFERVMHELESDDPRALVGTRVGAFRIEGLLGVGGMGAVYRALDTRSNQTVALKVLRAHAASRSAVARLEREARFLARLRHPCIARVLGAGTAGEGGEARPYFAMELLENAVPVTEWVRARGANVAETLALFVRVCDAVHHGHQRGVIHRDLKPHNVLVLPDGTPKLIDFGVAFATDADVSRVTVSTGVGALVGTFAYMSPEQCEGDPAAADTRSDVYALGVLLYELLAGERPHELEGRPLAEVLLAIRHGRTRRLESLRPDLAGDVATIVHKAMDPDPEQRYVSAADLSQDIARYLDDRPIEARPAGAMYHLRLLWRRHRGAVAGTALAAACVLGAGTVAVFFGVQARAGERRAEDALGLEAAARTRAERMTTFLRGAIGSANPYQPREITPGLMASEADPWAEFMTNPWTFAGVDGRKATVEDVLMAAGRRLPEEFADEPLALADLAETLGFTLYRLGQNEMSGDLLNRCVEVRLAKLGERDEATIRAMLRVAQWGESRTDNTATDWYTRAHALCADVYGKLDPRTLRAQRMLTNPLASRGEDTAKLLLASVPAVTEADGPRPPAQLVHLAYAAFTLTNRRDPGGRALGDEVLRRVRAGESDADIPARARARDLALRAVLGSGAMVADYQQDLATVRADAAAVFGEWSPEYMNTMSSLMRLGNTGGATADGAIYYAQAARAQLRLRGREHWETGNMLHMAAVTMGVVYGAASTAEETALAVAAAMEEFPQGVSTAGTLAGCILAYTDLQRGNADAALERVDAILRRMSAPQAPALFPQAWTRAHTSRGDFLRELGRFDEARRAYEEAMAFEGKFPNPAEGAGWTSQARKALAELPPP